MKSIHLVTVFVSSNASDHLLVCSILDGYGIYYHVKNEQVQNLFGVGQFSTGYNPITGPMEIRVNVRDKDLALNLIEDFWDSERSMPTLHAHDETNSGDKEARDFSRYLNAAIIIGLILPPLNIYHLYKAWQIKRHATTELKGLFKMSLATVLVFFGLIIIYRTFF